MQNTHYNIINKENIKREHRTQKSYGEKRGFINSTLCVDVRKSKK